MTNKETIEGILKTLYQAAKDGKMWSAEMYSSAALELQILLAEEEDRLAEMEQEVAKAKYNYLNERQSLSTTSDQPLSFHKRSVAQADIWIQTQKEWGEYRKQEMWVERIKGAISGAKLSAKVKSGY